MDFIISSNLSRFEESGTASLKKLREHVTVSGAEPDKTLQKRHWQRWTTEKLLQQLALSPEVKTFYFKSLWRLEQQMTSGAATAQTNTTPVCDTHSQPEGDTDTNTLSSSRASTDSNLSSIPQSFKRTEKRECSCHGPADGDGIAHSGLHDVKSKALLLIHVFTGKGGEGCQCQNLLLWCLFLTVEPQASTHPCCMTAGYF